MRSHSISACHAHSLYFLFLLVRIKRVHLVFALQDVFLCPQFPKAL